MNQNIDPSLVTPQEQNFDPKVTGDAPYKSTTVTGPARHLVKIACRCLEEQGVFDVKSADCNLNNEIHSIFDLSRWQRIIPEFYKKMKPALQLATLWITDDRLLDWFYEDTVSTTKVTIFDGRQEAYREPQVNIQDPAARQQARQLWLKKLDEFRTVGNLMFQFHAGNFWGAACDSPLHAEAYKVNPDIGSDPSLANYFAYVGDDGKWHTTARDLERPQIILTDVFQNFIDTIPDGNLQALPLDQKREILCFHFTLAMTIVHELAHVSNLYPETRLWNPNIGAFEEVFHSLEDLTSDWRQYVKNGKPELGWSWENKTFNGSIQPQLKFPEPCPPPEARVRFTLGSGWQVLVTKTPYHDAEQLHRKGIAYHDVGGAMMYPTESIAPWFRKEHWHVSRSKAELVKRPPNTYILHSGLKDGVWRGPNSWGPNTAIQVTVRSYNTADLFDTQ